MAKTPQNIQRISQRLLTTPATSPAHILRSSQRATAQQFFRPSRRTYSTAHIKTNASSYATITLLSAFSGAGVYYITNTFLQRQSPITIPNPASLPIPESLKATSKAATPSLKPFVPTYADYQNVYNAIATALWESTEYDDGSYAPVVLRLAWHSSGTYDAATNTGGSNGGLMRFESSPGSEASHGANKGLINARQFLAPIKAQFPWLSYGDLWTLAGVAAIQEMQGPAIPWRPGRQDLPIERSAPEGRLPDGSKSHDHVREVFGRMGFTTDRECVALSGAHAVGRCHVKNSGFDGPWTYSPTVLTNDYFRLLMEEHWDWKEMSDEWKANGGKMQYRDGTTGTLMMLPTDMALVKDEGMREWVERYAADGGLFFEDFSRVMVKLFELGVPFEEEGRQERWTFRSMGEQEAEEEG